MRMRREATARGPSPCAGVWEGTATKIVPDNFVNGGNNDWGTYRETPSFNYAMCLGPGSEPGTLRVFVEETCLVSRPPLPFSVLKRRLERRMTALGIKVKKVHDEEWSYIPLGGPLPLPTNRVLAFG